MTAVIRFAFSYASTLTDDMVVVPCNYYRCTMLVAFFAPGAGSGYKNSTGMHMLENCRESMGMV